MEKQPLGNSHTVSPCSEPQTKVLCRDDLPPSSGPHEEEGLRQIEQEIRKFQYFEPPPQLLVNTMALIQLKSHRPWWHRAYRWLKAPRSITFSPMQAVPVVAIFLIVISSTFHVWRSGDDPNLQAQLNKGIPIVLSVKVAAARSVSVIGSFNNWQPRACELQKKNGEAVWTTTLILPAGRYEYVFLVDGEALIPATNALHQDDGFGNLNNFLLVGNKNETSM